MKTATRVIELSHSIAADHVTPETDRRGRRIRHLSAGRPDRISMAPHSGTSLETPSHRFSGAPDLATTPLSLLADLPGVVVRLAGRGRPIEVSDLVGVEITGRAVLLHTGREPGAYLTADAAGWLAAQRATLVGTDAAGLDDPADPSRPAHSRLLLAGVPIAANLRRLDLLPDDGFRFHAAPPMIADMGIFPVRAYAVLND